MTKPKPELAPIRALRTVIAELNDKVLAEPRADIRFSINPGLREIPAQITVQSLSADEFDKAREVFGALCVSTRDFHSFRTVDVRIKGVTATLFGAAASRV